MTSFQKRILLQVAILIGVAALLFGVLLYLARDVRRRVDEISMTREEINSKIAMINSLASLKEDAASARAILPSLSSLLPSKEKLINFPKDVSRIARTHGFEANLIFTSDEKRTEGALGGFLFSLTALSGYSSFPLFLRDLQTLPFFVRFQVIDLVRGEKNQFTIAGSGQIFSR